MIDSYLLWVIITFGIGLLSLHPCGKEKVLVPLLKEMQDVSHTGFVPSGRHRRRLTGTHYLKYKSSEMASSNHQVDTQCFQLQDQFHYH